MTQMSTVRFEGALGRPQGGRGLVDHVQLGGAVRRDRLADPVMQTDQGVGEPHGAAHDVGMGLLKFIDIGAGKGDDQGSVRVEVAEADDRVGAAPGVEGDHQVGVLAAVFDGDIDPVTEVPQMPGPAPRGGAVSRPCLFFGRRDQANLHGDRPLWRRR